MIDSFGPGHFADVDKPFDAVFEFHEGTVSHHVHYFSGDTRFDREFVFDTLPRAGRLLLEPERDFFFFAVDVEDHHFDFFLDFDHVRGVIDPSPTHVGDVEQTVDASEVHERAEVGDILDRSGPEFALADVGHQRFFHLVPLFFDQLAPRDDDISAGLIDLEDHTLDLLPDECSDVMRTADIDLARRQEDVDSNVDQEATLDLAKHFTGDDVVLGVVFDDLFPLTNPVGLPLGEDNQAKFVFDFFQEHRDF